MCSRHDLLLVAATLLQMFVVLLLLSGEPAAAGKVTAIIVFGDSTVDTGNNNYLSTLVRSDFAPYGRDLHLAAGDGVASGGGNGRPTGRFSNGRLAVDFISEAFGLPPLVPAYLDPSVNISSLATGACFASAGAGYDNATSDLFSVLPLWKELDYFKEYVARLTTFSGDDMAAKTISEALYIVSMGTNDFLENYYATVARRGHATEFATATSYGDYLLTVADKFVRDLHALGARKVDLNGLPPMGCLPLERTTSGACTEEYNAVAERFNSGLVDAISKLNGELGDGARIVYGDVYSALAAVLADPAAYGVENVKAGCCGVTGVFEMGYMCGARSPLTCADASKFAFWDAIHPTERLHRVIADAKINTTLHVFILIVEDATPFTSIYSGNKTTQSDNRLPPSMASSQPLLLLVPLVAIIMTSPPAAAVAAGRSVPAVIVFGDSTVDTGNNNAIGTPLRSDFPPYGRDMPGGARATGRFGNGRLPPDFISQSLGLPPLVPAYLDPAYGIADFARGVCFASAGTGLDNATAAVLSVIPLWKEVEYYREYQRRLHTHVGATSARRIVRDALHVVSIGTNDFLENYYMLTTGRFAQFTISEYQDFLVAAARDFLTVIHRLGARRVTFAGLSPMGCLPLERTTDMILGGDGGCIEEYNKVARDYNEKMEAMVMLLRAKLPRLKLAFIPVYDNMVNFITNPEKFGLENVEEGCCATGRFEMGFMCNDVAPLTCDDADKYLFWDAFHPTEKINRFMAQHTLDICYQQGVL
uniref:GDSL esterase/lipase n=1 Tax=Leersia perrieri TaxID=77586 RepID=A0A0D9VD56_9ORYZ